MMILNLQFFKDDKNQAMELARLIADIEPAYRDDVIFLFSARFDTTHDRETVTYVSKKFPVKTFNTKLRVVGWPMGCNGLMTESYQHCIDLANGEDWVVLFMESDAVPLHKDWINILRKEYKDSGKMISGAWLKQGDAPGEHINGNCMMSTRFASKEKAILTPKGSGGWDAIYFSLMKRHAHPSQYIWSDYHLGTKRNPWKGDDFLWEPKKYGSRQNVYFGKNLHPVWFHGPKDMRGIEAVRKRLCKV